MLTDETHRKAVISGLLTLQHVSGQLATSQHFQCARYFQSAHSHDRGHLVREHPALGLIPGGAVIAQQLQQLLGIHACCALGILLLWILRSRKKGFNHHVDCLPPTECKRYMPGKAKGQAQCMSQKPIVASVVNCWCKILAKVAILVMTMHNTAQCYPAHC